MSNRRSTVPELPLPVGERRRDIRTGRALHCCCVCGHLGPWNSEWSWYGSYREVDDGEPVQKFCSDACKANQLAVTVEMAAEAREREHLPA